MNQKNWLKIWRAAAGLQVEEVENTLHWPPGTLARYEAMELIRVPLARVYSLIKIYQIDRLHLATILEEEMQGLQSDK